MAKTVTGGFTKYTSFVDDVSKDIEKITGRRVRKAAGYAARIMRRNAGKKGVSYPGGFPAKRKGALQRSIGFSYEKENEIAAVGSKSGKIHLSEFGHGDGKTQNKRPLIRRSLLQAEEGVIDIMSERYW